jgi:hypothetical protein
MTNISCSNHRNLHHKPPFSLIPLYKVQVTGSSSNRMIGFLKSGQGFVYFFPKSTGISLQAFVSQFKI